MIPLQLSWALGCCTDSVPRLLRLALLALAACARGSVSTHTPSSAISRSPVTGRFYQLVRVDGVDLTPSGSRCGLRASWLRFPGGSTWQVADSVAPCSGVSKVEARLDSGVFGFEGPAGADSIVLFLDVGNDRVPTWVGPFGYEVLVLRHKVRGTERVYVHRPAPTRSGQSPL
jgi:hypothetical protein